MKFLLSPFVMKFGLIAFVLCLGCQTEDDPKVVGECNSIAESTCVVYQETYCQDPWGQGYNNDDQLIAGINSFLESLDAELNEIEINLTSSPEPCNACSCKTGRSISGKVKDKDLQEIKNLGFKEK